eukprot:SAG11_NODE_136_length_15118_cov_14.188495_8_plen_70_part_00
MGEKVLNDDGIGWATRFGELGLHRPVFFAEMAADWHSASLAEIKERCECATRRNATHRVRTVAVGLHVR